MNSVQSRFGFVTIILLALIAVSPAGSGQEKPKTGFFLPKSPIAAAYVLNRLSNKELIEAPRSEFDYVALLQRKGLDRKYRVEAIDGLASLRHTDAITELIGGVSDLDKKGEEFTPVLRELGGILLAKKAAELAPKRAELQKLIDTGQLAISRQIGWAGLMTADGSANRAWSEAASDSGKLADLLSAIPLLRDSAIRSALYSKVEPLVHKADSAEVRRAAIRAITALPGHDAETFNTLAELVKAGTERAAAVESLQRIPRKAWPKEQAGPLLESLVASLQSLPVEHRTEPDALSTFQFATDLASLLPPETAKAMNRTLRALGVSVFVLRTIPEIG